MTHTATPVLSGRWGTGRAHSGLGLTTQQHQQSCPPTRVPPLPLNMGIPSTIPLYPHEKAGGFECCPLKMPFLPKFRSGKNRDLVFYLSWASLFDSVGLGPGEQDCDMHNWGHFVPLWSLRYQGEAGQGLGAGRGHNSSSSFSQGQLAPVSEMN